MNGQIYTFYSYKGGVGRSMALANIAMYFYLRHSLNVLMIDWDLEAPGLERYFQSRYQLKLDNLYKNPGLADLIRAYKNRIRTPPTSEAESPYPTFEDHLITLDKNDSAQLRLLTAGQRSGTEGWRAYAEFVQGFDWANFYREWAGGGFIDWLREKARSSADVILIDSRTGVTEMGGVATQHMADAVVMLFAPNSENMENSARMARSFLSEEATTQRQGQPLPVITVPARVDESDSASYGDFLKECRELFAPLQMPDFGRSALQEMTLHYLPIFSYRERLLFGDASLEGIGSRLVSGYTAVASNIIALSPEGHELRVGRKPHGSVFMSYSLEAFDIADEIRRSLAERGIEAQASFHPDTWSTTTDEDDERQIENAQCLIVLVDHKTADSKLVRQYINRAKNLNKPILPLIVTPDEPRMPLALVSLQYLRWSYEHKPWEDLFSSLESIFSSGALQTHEVENTASTSLSEPTKRVYISYSRQDGREVSRRLYDVLRRNGYSVFIDFASLVGGQDWASEIEKNLAEADVLLVLLSPASTESNFIKNEIYYALNLNKRILPVMVKQTRVPLVLSSLQYIDFTKDYESGLKELLRELARIVK
ncbi:MAG: TIR domain-containing protein [Anaerolineae bacterium]|nr:TIR domain-containing protein [Anaerolineae bacterium]